MLKPQFPALHNTCVILPVNTLRSDNVIVNKSHDTFDWR